MSNLTDVLSDSYDVFEYGVTLTNPLNAQTYQARPIPTTSRSNPNAVRAAKRLKRIIRNSSGKQLTRAGAGAPQDRWILT